MFILVFKLKILQTISYNKRLGTVAEILPRIGSNDAIWSLYLVNVLNVDLHDGDVGPEFIRRREVEELLVELDLNTPAVPEVHH